MVRTGTAFNFLSHFITILGNIAENKSYLCRKTGTILISNFRHVLNVVCFLLGNSLASEFYMPPFRNTLSVPSS